MLIAIRTSVTTGSRDVGTLSLSGIRAGRDYLRGAPVRCGPRAPAGGAAAAKRSAGGDAGAGEPRTGDEWTGDTGGGGAGSGRDRLVRLDLLDCWRLVLGGIVGHGFLLGRGS